VTNEKLEELGRRLESTAFLFGAWRRRAACRALAEDLSVATVPLLARALNSHDDKVVATADAALRSLSDPAAIDALGALWFAGRDPVLGAMVAESGHVARQPLDVHLATAFKAGKRPELQADPSAAVRIVAGLLEDKDTVVKSGAQKCLRSLADPAAADALCELAIADPGVPAAVIVREKDYQPRDIGRRCLLFLLLGQVDRYFDLDFEFQHLRAEYRAADDGLRQRVGDVVRRSGDARLLGLFREVRRQKLASDLTEREAAIVLDVHARNKQWHDIFVLLFHIPLSSVVVALDILAKSGWAPGEKTEAALLAELQQVRAKVGKIPDAPPAPDVALGPVLGEWIERGRGDEFVRRDSKSLRATLARGTPPDAVAALAVAGRTTPGDVETARSHVHWLVRLACLALCELAPQFAFAEQPTGGEGGGMWVDQLAPALLDAAVYRRRAVALRPEQLDALQAALGKSGRAESQRLACGRLVEVLARHHLRHTIEVDERMSVEVSETAIEVEG